MRSSVNRSAGWVLLTASMLVACTARQAYEGVRSNARFECNKLFEPDRSACLEQSQDDYDAYQKKRESMKRPETTAP